MNTRHRRCRYLSRLKAADCSKSVPSEVVGVLTLLICADVISLTSVGNSGVAALWRGLRFNNKTGSLDTCTVKTSGGMVQTASALELRA